VKTLLYVKFAFVPLIAFWIGAPYLFADTRTAALAVAATQLMVGIAMASSVLMGRPWTALFSAAQWSGMNRDPLFLRINNVMSAMWAGMFFYMAGARALGAPSAAIWVPLAAASALSVVLPGLLVRRALSQRLAAAEPYRWTPPVRGEASADADVIIVGAGLGGLTAGALLADAGLRVSVLEQHVVAGGFAHTWLRKGRDGDARPVFRFDSGIHDVSGVWDGAPVHGLLRRLGVLHRLDWRRMDHRFQDASGRFDVPRGWDAYVMQLAARFPADREGVLRALADIRTIHAAMYSEAPPRSGVPGAPRTVAGMLRFARSHPLAVQWMQRPFAEFLRERVRDPAARQAIAALAGYVTDDLGKATVASMVPLFGYYLHGGFYPAGGSGRLAQVLVEAIESRGGRVRLKTAVDRIVVEGGRARGVRLASGGTLSAPAVVLNADFLAATRHLVDSELWPRAFRDELSAMRPACSAIGVHLGVRGTFDDARPIIHVSGPQGGAGIVIPSLVDPTAAPAGYSTVEILRLVSHAEARDWTGDIAPAGADALRETPAYLERKRAACDALVRAAEQALPGLASRIVYRADATPVTFLRYDWSSAGAIYGCDGAARSVTAKSPIAGLVFAGAATHGAGVEAVMISGANAAEALVPGLLDSPVAPEPAIAQASAPAWSAGRPS
jgi:all-trans-retinol 13,14-reductase